jgi:hypothetical protein
MPRDQAGRAKYDVIRAPYSSDLFDPPRGKNVGASRHARAVAAAAKGFSALHDGAEPFLCRARQRFMGANCLRAHASAPGSVARRRAASRRGARPACSRVRALDVRGVTASEGMHSELRRSFSTNLVSWVDGLNRPDFNKPICNITKPALHPFGEGAPDFAMVGILIGTGSNPTREVGPR